TKPSIQGFGSATPAGSESDCCWPTASADHTGCGNPSQSSDHAPHTSARRPKSSAAQPKPRHRSPRTTASHQSSASYQDNGALQEAPGNVLPRPLSQAAPQHRRDPTKSILSRSFTSNLYSASVIACPDPIHFSFNANSFKQGSESPWWSDRAAYRRPSWYGAVY